MNINFTPLNPSNKPNNSRSVDSVANEIVNLETTLANNTLHGNVGSTEQPQDNLETINHISDNTSITNHINELRQNMLGLIQEDESSGLDAAVNKVDEIRNKINCAEWKSRELEALLTTIILAPEMLEDIDPNTDGIQVRIRPDLPGDDDGDGIITADLPTVKRAFISINSYIKELGESQSFWEKEEESRMKEVLQGPVQKDEMFYGVKEGVGLVGITAITKLQDSLNDLIRNPDSLGDANQIRAALDFTMMHFSTQLEKAKDEPWYEELKELMADRQRLVQEQLVSTTKQLESFDKLLSDLISNPDGKQIDVDPNTSGIQVHSVDFSYSDRIDENGNVTIDANIVRQALFSRRALMGELIKEQKFLSKVAPPEETPYLELINHMQNNTPIQLEVAKKQQESLITLLSTLISNPSSLTDIDSSKEGVQVYIDGIGNIDVDVNPDSIMTLVKSLVKEQKRLSKTDELDEAFDSLTGPRKKFYDINKQGMKNWQESLNTILSTLPFDPSTLPDDDSGNIYDNFSPIFQHLYATRALIGELTFKQAFLEDVLSSNQYTSGITNTNTSSTNTNAEIINREESLTQKITEPKLTLPESPSQAFTKPAPRPRNRR